MGKRKKLSMEGLLDDNILLKTSIADMKRIVLAAYRKLFASDMPTTAWAVGWQRVKGQIVSKVSDQQRAKLEQQLTEKEMVAVLRALPAGKSSGHDGFPLEFCRLFWAELKGLVLDGV